MNDAPCVKHLNMQADLHGGKKGVLGASHVFFGSELGQPGCGFHFEYANHVCQLWALRN